MFPLPNTTLPLREAALSVEVARLWPELPEEVDLLDRDGQFGVAPDLLEPQVPDLLPEDEGEPPVAAAE